MAGYYGSAVYGRSTYGPAQADAVATIAMLKAHLGGVTNATDEQLAAVLDVALDLAERYCGRIFAARLVTQVADGGRPAILLHATPVQSVESVTENGATVPPSGYVADRAAGILWRGSSPSVTSWASGVQNVTVITVAGPDSVQPTVRHAVLELGRHLWDTQRGGSRLPRQAGAGDDWDPRAGYSLPRRVAELLDAHRAPGIA